MALNQLSSFTNLIAYYNNLLYINFFVKATLKPLRFDGDSIKWSESMFSKKTKLLTQRKQLFRSCLLATLTVIVVSCGGDSSTTTSNTTVPVTGEEPQSLTLIAGNLDGLGYKDSPNGPASIARFNQPSGIANDRTGNVYVADTHNQVIRKITPSGRVTTLAGNAGLSGSADGTGAAARFSYPIGLSTDSAGNVYVADTGNHTIRKISPVGVVTTLAGTAGMDGSTDGTGAAAKFTHPRGISTDSAGNVYVADSITHTIRKISSVGVVTTLAGTAGLDGSTDGTGAAARFSYPIGLSTDSAGNVYVADTGNHTIRKISPVGVVTTLAGTAGMDGSTDGTGAAAKFRYPVGLSTDSAGNVYVAETVNYTIRKITLAGVVTTLAGTAGQTGSTDGTGAAARFYNLAGLSTDNAGNVYVADTDNHTIRKITPAGMVTTFAGTASQTGSTDGAGSASRFYNLRGLTLDATGNLYLADGSNQTIRKITPTGQVTTLAGKAGKHGSSDGTGDAARFTSPNGITIDIKGNLFVSDTYNNTIRKITPAGVVTTLTAFAGEFESPYQVDESGAVRFGVTRGIKIDSSGNLYVTDRNEIHKITSAGVVSRVAGRFGDYGSRDGLGKNALFWEPNSLDLDSAGNLYVADTENHTIRKISINGQVTTLAGAAELMGSDDGTGGSARFNRPAGLTIDNADNVYVADTGNHTIRKITPTGVVTTIAGSAGIPGFDGTKNNTRLAYPVGLAISGNSLYITMLHGIVKLSPLP